MSYTKYAFVEKIRKLSAPLDENWHFIWSWVLIYLYQIFILFAWFRHNERKLVMTFLSFIIKERRKIERVCVLDRHVTSLDLEGLLVVNLVSSDLYTSYDVQNVLGFLE